VLLIQPASERISTTINEVRKHFTMESPGLDLTAFVLITKVYSERFVASANVTSLLPVIQRK
jgi:hypothetical protein